MKTERRRQSRQPLNGDTVIVVDKCSEKTATVVDVSIDGLQLRYAPASDACHHWSFVDLYDVRNSNETLIADLPCRPVYDIPSLMEGGSFSGSTVRTCGVVFERVSADQKAGLELLLRNAAGSSSVE